MPIHRHNEINLRVLYLYNKMSSLNRIKSTASRVASNVLSGARRLALSVIPVLCTYPVLPSSVHVCIYFE